jgi:hypothetical protein
MIRSASSDEGETRVLPRAEWEWSRDEYLARVRPWAEDRLRRMSRREKHPVYDFLFEYYSFRPAHLLRWTPGFGVALQSATRDDILWYEFQPCDGGLSLSVSAFPAHRAPYLRWAVEYLHTTLHREPTFACAGMHEWAMVYREPNIRHTRVPLRLLHAETDAVVESQALRCSHYDAFRFFAPAAVPRNRWELTRAATTDHDQPGCLHVNMDLYRFAYKIAPFCPSDVVADAFELARAAREIDMRASPYDLAALGFAPIKVETAEGRAEYVERQREVFRGAQPVRERLLGVYRGLLDHVPGDHHAGGKFGLCDASRVD